MPSLRSSTRGTAVTMRGAAKSPLSSVSHQRGTSMDQYFDIIIVGRRPAGSPAAVYARRAGKSVLLLERESFAGRSPPPQGGKLSGPAAVSGAELAERLYSQAEALETESNWRRRWRSRAARPAGWSPTTVPIPAGAVILAAGMRRPDPGPCGRGSSGRHLLLRCVRRSLLRRTGCGSGRRRQHRPAGCAVSGRHLPPCDG